MNGSVDSTEDWIFNYQWNSRYLSYPAPLHAELQPQQPLPDSEFYPYQLIFTRLEKLPLPESRVRKGNEITFNPPEFLQFNLSFIDRSSQKFFGNTFTWQIPFSLFETNVNEIASPRRGSVPVGISGSTLSGILQNKSIFFHSNLASHSVAIVIEISEKRGNFLNSLGWTFFNPFNPAKGGLDAGSVWHYQNVDIVQRLNLPLYQGTPRMLILPSFATWTEDNQFNPISHASISLKLTVCDLLQPYCPPWPKNFFADEYLLPIELEQDELYACRQKTVNISRLEISTESTFIDMEERLMQQIWENHLKENPELAEGSKIRKSAILERKAHIGFHNSYFYCHEPTVVNLEARYSSDTGEPDKYVFLGKLDLKKPVKSDRTDNSSLTILVEYKIRMDFVLQAPKRGFFSNLKKQLNPSFDPTADYSTLVTVVKDISVGWAAAKNGSFVRVPLMNAGILNPFKKFGYVDLDNSSNKKDDDGVVHAMFVNCHVEQAVKLKSPIKQIAPLLPIEPPVIVEEQVVQEQVVVQEQKQISFSDKATSNPNLIVKEPSLHSIKPIPNVKPTTTAAVLVDKPLLVYDEARLADAGFSKFNMLPESRAFIDPNKEYSDPYSLNEFEFQLMALDFNDSMVQNVESCLFSVKFYDFAEMNMFDSLQLYSGSMPRALSQSGQVYSPSILYQAKRLNSPGIEFNFQVDVSLERISEALSQESSTETPFIKYMRNGHLRVDVVNSDSLMYIGSALIPLSHLLRQSKTMVHYQAHVDLVDLSVALEKSNFKTVGKLYLNMSNIGRPSLKASSALALESRSHLIPISRTGVAQETIQVQKKETASNSRLELVDRVFSSRPELSNIPSNRRVFVMSLDDQHQQLLKSEIDREQTKPVNLDSYAKQYITCKHSLTPSLGEATYLEWEFKSTIQDLEFVILEWSDADLRLVLDASETEFIRKLVPLSNPEFKYFDFKDGKHRMLVNFNQVHRIPLIYQSFVPDQVPKTVVLTILNSKTLSELAILELDVQPRGIVVGHHVRLLASADSDVNTVFSLNSVDTVGYLKPCNPNVTSTFALNRPDSVHFTAKSVEGRVYILEFHDPTLLLHKQTIEVQLSRYQLMDIDHTDELGACSFVLAGGSKPRSVLVYSSDREQLKVSTSPITIVPKGVVNVPFELSVNCNREPFLLHVIDQQTLGVAGKWLVRVKKTFVTKIVDLVLSVGRSTSKKLSYTNSLGSSQVFSVKTDRPDLLQIKNPLIQMSAGSSEYIHMQFNPFSVAAVQSILVYISDSNGRTIDCLQLKTTYVY